MHKYVIEEIKSLVVLGGLPTVGYIFGSIIAVCCGFVGGVIPGVCALVGTILAIVITLRRILKLL